MSLTLALGGGATAATGGAAAISGLAAAAGPAALAALPVIGGYYLGKWLDDANPYILDPYSYSMEQQVLRERKKLQSFLEKLTVEKSNYTSRPPKYDSRLIQSYGDARLRGDSHVSTRPRFIKVYRGTSDKSNKSIATSHADTMTSETPNGQNNNKPKIPEWLKKGVKSTAKWSGASYAAGMTSEFAAKTWPEYHDFIMRLTSVDYNKAKEYTKERDDLIKAFENGDYLYDTPEYKKAYDRLVFLENEIDRLKDPNLITQYLSYFPGIESIIGNSRLDYEGKPWAKVITSIGDGLGGTYLKNSIKNLGVKQALKREAATNVINVGAGKAAYEGLNLYFTKHPEHFPETELGSTLLVAPIIFGTQIGTNMAVDWGVNKWKKYARPHLRHTPSSNAQNTFTSTISTEKGGQ